MTPLWSPHFIRSMYAFKSGKCSIKPFFHATRTAFSWTSLADILLIWGIILSESFLRFIIWRVEFWNIWRKFQKQRAYGRENALYLTSVSRLSTVWNRARSSFVMGASNRWVMPTWNLLSGSMEFLVLTVTQRNLKKRKRGQELDKGNSRHGASSVVRTKAGDQNRVIKMLLFQIQFDRSSLQGLFSIFVLQTTQERSKYPSPPWLFYRVYNIRFCWLRHLWNFGTLVSIY